MGVAYRALPSMPSRREEPRDRRAYDTTRTVNGMTNVGHDAGKRLTDAGRYQLIELLEWAVATGLRSLVRARVATAPTIGGLSVREERH